MYEYIKCPQRHTSAYIRILAETRVMSREQFWYDFENVYLCEVT
jgi:hypothetical protein